MILDSSTLPDDPDELKRIICELQDSHAAEVHLLQEQVRHLYDKLFGRKSEKSRYGEESPQLPLFDMPEPDPDAEAEETVEVEQHTRRKRGRKPLPDNLPRVEIVHDIDEQEKICHCGAELSRIGEEVSEKLDIIPAVIQVVRHIRPKYSCKNCENVAEKGPTVKVAPAPLQLIPKAIASGGLMAHILTAKFVDSLPFYRQERQFDRLGADISRATMCRWAMRVAEACIPLKALLRQEILSGPLINADETTVQVLKEPGKPANSTSYMWVFRGGPVRAPSFYFQYHQTRAKGVAIDFLEGYKGVVQTDGYAGYDFLDEKTDVAHLGCWAHARRKFMEAKKARGKNSKKTGGPDVALQFIKDLYRIERRAQKQNLSAYALSDLRQKEAKPILEKMHAWLIKKSMHLVPKSLLGKAVAYALNQWNRLKCYIDFPFATPDNNLAENAIRPFCVGRRNWLFAGTPAGAEASATIYSLVETAKANSLEPYRYLRYLFERVPVAQTVEDYKQLMPGYLTPEMLEEVSKVSLV
ncbi:IS66 family transposase [Desulfopila sp. IMCC35008]|uniref:IS66 family transposase n=1 Tax=Desulfopila sp. IMCC35008 TaxID=2653858 RepID=UPI0013D80A1D|nr:IS66 family transposase [Desulfopila sp. IMCC35008]